MRARDWFGAFLMGVACAIIITGGIYVRITNIDASETRILVDYWWMWLAAIVCAVVGLLLSKERT